MQPTKHLTAILFTLSLLGASCNNEEKPADTAAAQPVWKEESITYEGDSTTMNGYIVYDENNKDKRPAVLVVHEWWGLNDYPKRRARELAALGYVAMAVDIYGNGKTADNPDSAMKYSMPFYVDPQKAKRRMDAAIAKIKTYGQVDASKIREKNPRSEQEGDGSANAFEQTELSEYPENKQRKPKDPSY